MAKRWSRQNMEKSAVNEQKLRQAMIEFDEVLSNSFIACPQLLSKHKGTRMLQCQSRAVHICKSNVFGRARCTKNCLLIKTALTTTILVHRAAAGPKEVVKSIMQSPVKLIKLYLNQKNV